MDTPQKIDRPRSVMPKAETPAVAGIQTPQVAGAIRFRAARGNGRSREHPREGVQG